MDGGFVAAEESRRRDKPLTPPSKCAGSPVPIKAIAIDLNCPMEEIPSPKHEHFSILGYVSEMRKKDTKVCLPFASSEGGDDVNLPPLPVPKFRWWQCSDCVPDNFDQKSTLGIIHAHDKSDAGTSSFHNGAREKDSLLLLQNIGDEHASGDSMDYNYASDKLMDINSEGHKSTPYVWNNGGGNSFPLKTTEANNQFQMKEINLNNSAAKNPSTGPHEPERASSLRDEDISLSSLPPKRKRKLRSLADIIKKDTNLIPTQQIEDDLNPHDYLEASLDAPKCAAKTPQRKRKMVLEEEEEEEMVPPIAIDKKLKGLVTESENYSCNNNNNTFNIVEISESESEKDDSRPKLFGSRLGAKTRKNKARKKRSIDINRKVRRADTENRTFGPPVAAGTNVAGKGSFFKKSLFGQQMDSIPDVSIDKRVEEGHYSPYTTPSNQDGLGDRNNKIQEKVTLDLSLSSYVGGEMNLEKQESSGRHTEIPDLNESFVEKVSMAEGLQLPTFPEKALHKNSDMFAPSNKQTDNNTGVVERGGTSDDIPMEIVELLAKNQHERALDDSKKHPRSNGFHNNSNSFKGSSSYIQGTPCMLNFPYPNAISGLSVPSGTTNFLNFPPPKNCHSNSGQFRQCSPLMPGQHKIGLGPNIVSGQRPSDGADLLWPPWRKTVTFDLGPPSGSKDQAYKGKNVKRAVTDGSLVREGGISSGSKPMGSTMDAYSNDTIPAMQLLSLMNQRIVTSSSLKVGGPNNSFPNRQFSPCNEHPRLINKNHNQNDPFNSSSSFFGQSSRTADFPAMLNGVGYSGDSSKKSLAGGRMPPLKGNSKPIDLAGPSNLSAGQPWRNNLKLDVCMLNRNPADFSIPDARNEFMISAKDLKTKKRNPSKQKSLPRNVDEPKKQRVRKDSSRRK